MKAQTADAIPDKSSLNTKHVVVLGAGASFDIVLHSVISFYRYLGVIGLTTAISILESASKTNYLVTILASHLPNDPKSIDYTSHWAGAHHVSHATGTGISAPDANSSSTNTEHPEQLAIDQETFRTMWDLSAQGSDAEKCLMRIEQVEYYHEEIPVDKDSGQARHHLSWYPDFKILSSATLSSSPLDLLAQGIRSGVSFNTLTIDTPVYLRYLYQRFVDKGGIVLRGRVDDIRDLKELQRLLHELQPTASDVQIDALINCTGLGSRTLLGVEDDAVYPLRGQTVLLRAPWITFGRTISSKGKEGKEDLWTYIIPRRSGDIIVGGIKTPNDSFPTPRPETTIDILRRSLRLCPELLHPQPVKSAEIRSGTTQLSTDSPSIPNLDQLSDSDLLNLIEPLMVEAGCGLRPARNGGVRLDVEWIESTRRIPIIHNYGHSGSGFQSSWGSATRAWRLLEGVL
ncbi:D-amino-acid oxidase [Lentinula detonsa]|uniref:D-amino-acid oxidase n=1 Tax=Lentinula detonsa TaxID=2804962 RepID=A0AA38PTE1_9AGAR|nr:D-amino-acid oxidase [Lentinula detonsa]